MSPNSAIGCFLHPVFKFKVRTSIVRVSEEFQESEILGKKGGKNSGVEVCVAVCLHGKEVIEDLCFLWQRLVAIELVIHPI